MTAAMHAKPPPQVIEGATIYVTIPFKVVSVVATLWQKVYMARARAARYRRAFLESLLAWVTHGVQALYALLATPQRPTERDPPTRHHLGTCPPPVQRLTGTLTAAPRAPSAAHRFHLGVVMG